MTVYKITVKHELNKCDKNYFLFREKNGIWVTEYYWPWYCVLWWEVTVITMSCFRDHSPDYFGSSSSHISSLSTPSSLLTKGNHFLRKQSVCGLEVQHSPFHAQDWRPQHPGLCGRALGHVAPPMQGPLPYLSHLSQVQSSDFWHQLHKLGQALQVKGTFPPHKTALTTDISHELWGPQATWHCWPTGYKFGGSHDAFRFNSIQGWVWKTLNTWLKFYHKEYISQGYTKDLGEVLDAELLCSLLCPQGCPPLSGTLMYSPIRKFHLVMESSVFTEELFHRGMID